MYLDRSSLLFSVFSLLLVVPFSAAVGQSDYGYMYYCPGKGVCASTSSMYSQDEQGLALCGNNLDSYEVTRTGGCYFEKSDCDAVCKGGATTPTPSIAITPVPSPVAPAPTPAPSVVSPYSFAPFFYCGNSGACVQTSSNYTLEDLAQGTAACSADLAKYNIPNHGGYCYHAKGLCESECKPVVTTPPAKFYYCNLEGSCAQTTNEYSLSDLSAGIGECTGNLYTYNVPHQGNCYPSREVCQLSCKPVKPSQGPQEFFDGILRWLRSLWH